ncbi:uncharacterized protein METZ01_LOCUS513774, partial [marine metagenome]
MIYVLLALAAVLRQGSLGLSYRPFPVEQIYRAGKSRLAPLIIASVVFRRLMWGPRISNMKYSRLDQFIRRIKAQRACLNMAARL